jgi:hypothetical protein
MREALQAVRHVDLLHRVMAANRGERLVPGEPRGQRAQTLV